MSKRAVVTADGLIALPAEAFCAVVADVDSVRLIVSIQGPNLYGANSAVCHGPNAPFDLTRISAKDGGMFPLAKVRRIISGEEALPSGHGTRQMPIGEPIYSQVAWDQDLGRVRIDNLARHIESLQGK